MYLTTTVGEAAVIGGLGYAVVFFGLILLMLVIMITGKIMSRKKAHAEGTVAVAEAPAAPAKKSDPAPGSAGEIKLHDVSDRDAAMIMAIVANKLGRPLNELRFKSIKEVK